MEEMIKKIFNEKMNDGTFEKIVSEKFEQMITEICKDLTSWNGSIKKQMQEKIEPLMSDAIEKSDFNEYTIKLIDIINQSLKQSNLNQYRVVADNLKALLGHKEIEYKWGGNVKISSIFEKYIEFVEESLEESDFKRDEINTDDGTKTTYVECRYFVEEDEYCEDRVGYFSNKRSTQHIIFTNDKAEEDDDIATKTRVEFDVYESFDGTKHLNFDTDFKISELRTIPSFILDLMDIKNKYCNIFIDKRKDEGAATFNFEWNWN